MNKECYSLQPPKIEVFPIHGGTDIILRKNIKKTTKEPMEEGGDSTIVYECDEVQLRHKGTVTKTEVNNNFEYIEPDNRRTYVEIGQSSPAGEDFSMVIDFDEENQADSFKDSLESYYEDFDIDEHIEMWIEAKRSGTSGVPSTRELVKDAEAIDGMILELSQALQKVNIPVLVGSYTPPDENGEGEKIVREFYGQGHIFKDEDAFYHRPDDPCYIPELSDTVYTRNSILQECNQQDDLAEEVFEALDWQHVSSLLEDWQRNGELDTCKECGKMFNCYGVTKCPYCGADYEGGDE